MLGSLLDVPWCWTPVLQGRSVADYLRHVIDLADVLYALADVYRRIIRELHLFRLQGLYAGGAAVSNAEHVSILRAIQTGDSEAAAQAMRGHIEGARLRMRKAVKAATGKRQISKV